MADAFENEAETPANFPFRLVQLDARNMSIVRSGDRLGFSPDGFFRDSTRGNPTLGPGDTLSITILEPASGGLFSGIDAANTGGQGTKIVTLPDTQIDKTGMITFPFVGDFKAVGKTPREVGAMLEESLKSKIIQPQVIVRLSSNLFNKAVIGGAVKLPGEFDVTPAGETLLQLVARAGGPTSPPSDIVVRMRRDRTVRSVRLQAFIDHPLADIHMKSGDFVNLIAVPRTYTILGATGAAGLKGESTDFPLPPERLSLASALGRSGGLDDNRANVKGLFILRYERRSLADLLGPPLAAPGTTVPVAYRIDLSKAGGPFLAEQFTMRERDVVVLSDAPATEVNKLLNLFRLAASPVFSAASAGSQDF